MRSWLVRALPLVGVVVVGVIAYGESPQGEFVWDDRPLIVENRMVRDPAEFSRIFTSSFWETGDRDDRFRTFFRPLVSASYAADHTIWGLDPRGFHLTNLALHLICCGLVYAIARRERIAPWVAAFAAGLFAVHPVHVESVAWISGRTDVLCAAFMLGAYALVPQGVMPRQRWRWLAAMVCLFLALLAKEMAATLPLIVAIDRWMRPRAGRSASEHARGALWAGALLGLPLLAYGAVRLGVLEGSGLPLYELGPLSFLATAVFALARYTLLLLWPVGLDAHYPYAAIESLFEPLAIVSLLIVALVAVAGVALWRIRSRATYWIVWVFVTLLPVLAFGRFGDVILADRFLYIPSVGFCLLAAWGLSWLLAQPQFAPPVWRHACAWGGLVVVTTLAVASVERVRVWRDDLTLFSEMMRTSPDSALVNSNYAMALYHRGRLDEAIEPLRRAISIEPRFATAWNSLAAVLDRQGRGAEAMRAYAHALKLAPDMLEARINAAHLQVRMGRHELGLRTLEDVVARHPRHGGALYALGHTVYATGDSARALGLLERARRADPASPVVHYLVGKIRSERGDSAEAAQAMQTFLTLWPSDDSYAEAARRIVDRAPASHPRTGP